MFNVLRSKRKYILNMLFTTLGTMWLSFAIAPCVLAAALVERLHHCCPTVSGETGSSEHMHDQGKCVSCELVEPVLQSADEYIHIFVSSNFVYDPTIIEWHIHQITKPVNAALKFSTPVYQTIPPPFKYRVLLI